MREIRAFGHVFGSVEDLDPDDTSGGIEIEHDARTHFLAPNDRGVGELHVECVRLTVIPGFHACRAPAHDRGML